MLGEICQFSNTIVTKFCPTSSPGFGMHRLQVTVVLFFCTQHLWSRFMWKWFLNLCSSAPVFFPFLQFFHVGLPRCCSLNIYFVLSALLTSNEVAFILITVVKSPFGHKIMFRVNQISEPGVAHMLITSILDKLSWARMPGDLSSNGQILLSLRRQIFQPN